MPQEVTVRKRKSSVLESQKPAFTSWEQSSPLLFSLLSSLLSLLFSSLLFSSLLFSSLFSLFSALLCSSLLSLSRPLPSKKKILKFVRCTQGHRARSDLEPRSYHFQFTTLPTTSQSVLFPF